MATKFNLTAQLQLQAPRNTAQVVSQIQRQLSGVSVPVRVDNAPRAVKQLKQVSNQAKAATTQAEKMGKAFGVSLKRFTAFAIASRGVALFTSTLANAVEESIGFQRELVKISQVTGKSISQLKSLSDTVTELSTSLGVSSKSLLSTGRILSQAGIQAKELEIALDALAKTTLAPTFDDITKTAEGAVAIIAQFGQGVGALEAQLGAINKVAGQFAVESGDLISAVRRTGGVFKAAGGDLNELLALFTSVRATTRESAESIATGLRTIFTRIQRPKTIEFLKQYGVELTDLEGKFVGPFEAVRRLSLAFRDLEEGDITFVRIAEELGGFRQIGKVIPLIKEFNTAEKARQAALSGGTSLTKDAASAQIALAVQFQKVREEFFSLIRAITETSTFQVLTKTALNLASALIRVADAFKPLIPLIGAFAAFKAVKGIGSFAAGIGSGLKSAKGFNSGGIVPGSGNRDTVPAMLTPGEFVIRKSSVKKLGAGTLSQMNNNRYASGGTVRPKDPIGYVAAKQGETPESNLLSKSQEALGVLRKKGIRPKGSKSLPDSHLVNVEIPYSRLAIKSEKEADFAGSKATTLALNTIDKFLNAGKAKSGFPKNPPSNISGDEKANSSLNGYIFEQIVGKFAKTANNQPAEAKGGNTPFDFVGVASLGNSIENTPVPKFLDAARTKKTDEDMKTKALNAVSKQGLKFTSSGFIQRRKNALGGLIQKFALGGLAQKNKVGFAILDPDQDGSDLKTSVTRAQIRSAVSGTDAQKKALNQEISWSNKDYTIARQGLPEKVSKKFYDTIINEAVTGVDNAANSLSQTLGQGAISMPNSAKSTMAGVVAKSGSQMGRLFEDVLDVIDNRGDFKPAPKGAFWDFKNGLNGGLATTYNKMPSSFVDARTSYGRSGANAAQGKIIGEIAEQYENTSTFKNAKAKKKAVPASALAAQEKRRAKQQAKIAKMNAKITEKERPEFAKGGAAPSDTVPALLTPGEFVINAKAASKIGPANLNRMNKRGVKGFAKGGFVGVQRFANGGGPKPGSDIDGSGIVDMSGFTNEIKGITLNLKSLKKAAGAVENNFFKAAQLTEKSNANLIALGQEEQELKALMNDENASQAEKNEIKARLNDVSKQILKETEINLKAQAEENKLTQQSENIQKNINSEERKKASAIKSANEAKQKGRDKARAGTGSLKQANVRADNEATRANVELPEKGEGKDFAKIAGTIFAANAALETIRPTIDENSGALAKMSDSLITTTSTLINFGAGLSAVLPEGSFDAIKDTLFSGTDKDGRINLARARTEKRIGSGITSVGEKGQELGKSVSKLGDKLKDSDNRLVKKLGGLVSKGGGGLSQAGGGLVGNAGALSGTLATAATAAASFAAIAGVTVGITAGLSQAMDALTGVHEKAKKAIEEGNVAQAGTAAVNSQLQKDANKAALAIAGAGAAAGFAFGGPFGAAIGGAIFGLAGLALKTEAGQVAMGKFRDNVLTIFGAETTDLIAKRATVEATAIRNQKQFADNAKEAARAMEDVKDGSRSLTEALESGDLTRNSRNQAQLALATLDVEKQAADESFSSFSLATSAIPVVGLFGSSAETQQEDIGKAKIQAEEKKRQALNKVIDENRAQFDAYGKELFALGQNSGGVAVSLGVFRQEVADSLGVAVSEIPPKTLQDLDAKFLSNAKRVTANTRAFAAATVGVQGLTDFAEGATSEIGKVSSVLDGSFNSVRSSSDLLSDALSGARVSENSFDNALENLTSGFEEFGIEERSLNKVKSNVQALGSVTKNFDSAVAKVADDLSKGVDDDGNLISKKDFKDKILENIIPENASEQDQAFLKDFFGDIKFDPDDVTKSLEGDFSGILKTLGDKAGEGFEEIKEAAESVANAQDALVNVTRQRIQVENQFIQAQQQNIALQQEAAQALSDFGINTLTTSEKVELAQKKLATSFSGRTFGGPGDVQAQIRSLESGAIAAIQQNRGALTGTGPQGTEFAANSDLIAKSQDQLNATIEYSRTRIALYKEELDIVRKKNAAEKSSLESLLDGDIESFIQGQQQAAAASALRSGDATAASLFGSKALGGALKDLEGQGLSGAQMDRASSLALSSAGIQGQVSAQVLAGTTDEEKAIMAGVEAEAETLRAAGVAQETIASEQLTTAKLGETQAVNALKDAQIKAANAATEFAKSMDLAKEAANKREQQTNDIQKDVLADAQARQKAEINAPVVQAQKEIQASMQARAVDSSIAPIGAAVSRYATGGIPGALAGGLGSYFSQGDPTQMTQADMDKLDAARKKSAELATENEERNRRELDRIRRSYSKGGPVYAKNGFYAGASNMFKNIFKPRGVDTVPAMLQAGEFVMSKKGVQSGNNLNMLKGMNQGMSGIGGMGLENIGAILKDGASTLMKPAETMVHAAEQLKNTFANTNIGMSVSPFNVNVNFNGASFLESLTDDIKARVMTDVVEEMKKMAFDNSGNSLIKKGVL